MRLTGGEALALRMISLLLREHPRGRPRDVAGVVEWFGAMQAQDAASGLWSLGARLPGCTVADVRAALERREALRTWPMRGTVHLVPPRDARWMLELIGVRALGGAAARRAASASPRPTPTGPSTCSARRWPAAAGSPARSAWRALAAAGVDPAGQRGYHLLWYASQRGVTCIAPHVGTEQTFVLLDEWAPDAAPPRTRRGARLDGAAVLPLPRADHPAGLRRLDGADRGGRPARASRSPATTWPR